MLYDGEIFTHRGRQFRIQYPHDDTMGPPWKEHDGHGPVTEWVTRDKMPNERLLIADRSHKRYYDMAEAMTIAKRDKWGEVREGESAGQRAARAVEADFQSMRRYCEGEWRAGSATSWRSRNAFMGRRCDRPSRR